MKIAILGTRGIPNHYGGFEQYAELLSVYLAAEGWDVTVYNSHDHPYQEVNYKGVKIKHIYDPEKKIGTIGQFIYDLGCIYDTRQQKFDIVYQLGYTSSAVFNFLFPTGTTIVTNMDGMEWKRSKYSKSVQKFLMYAEKIAVKRSNFLVADSLGIKAYLDQKYKKTSFYSAYTAVIPSDYSEAILTPYSLLPKSYNLVIARLEPENNVQTIIEAHVLNKFNFPLLVVGNHQTKYGNYLAEQYKQFPHIRFVGSIYQKSVLDSLRHYAQYYFHGHSVGGTNPSLLEAMACGCNIIAHNNIFNKSVLEEHALYFDDAASLHKILISIDTKNIDLKNNSNTNIIKIKTFFSEQQIFSFLKEKLIEWRNKKLS